MVSSVHCRKQHLICRLERFTRVELIASTLELVLVEKNAAAELLSIVERQTYVLAATNALLKLGVAKQDCHDHLAEVGKHRQRPTHFEQLV